MKDLQKAIEEMLDNYYIQKVGFIVADINISDSADFIKELTQLITSREQEIKREAVLEFVQFYFDNPEIEDIDDVVNKFLSRQKEQTQ